MRHPARRRLQPTEYGEGEFERAFAERPRLALHYPRGISPVDLAMLPLIVAREQAEHPGCALRLRSVQDDGNGRWRPSPSRTWQTGTPQPSRP